ncbi:MAG: fatty-acid synthase [Anaerolineae bacterium]|nr:fatty-acid synthase [Anaerolineae bacterium]
MPVKDRYHDAVKHAFIKDGWTINDEQFSLTVDQRNLWIDLQVSKAEPSIVILVEVKELAEVDSAIEALANALGKIDLYRLALANASLSLPLYLAVSKESYAGILSEKIGQLAIESAQIPLIVFDPEQEEILKWIP